MKAILFSTKEEADNLISEINQFVGSTAVSSSIESDEGWIVLVPVVSTSSEVLDLPAMVVDKHLVVPEKAVSDPDKIPSTNWGAL